jgi:hypothetical protein
MKQHIDQSQLDELSPEAKERLREWWKPVRGDLCYHERGGLCVVLNNYEYELVVGYEPNKIINVDVQIMRVKTKQFLPLLSIGQMIGFLDEHSSNDMYLTQRGDGVLWQVYIDNNDLKSLYNGDTLCDALWSVCKGILEENESKYSEWSEESFQEFIKEKK